MALRALCSAEGTHEVSWRGARSSCGWMTCPVHCSMLRGEEWEATREEHAC